MLKKLLSTIFIAGFLSSCVVDDSKQAYKYEILKALDKGEYDKVIQLLEKDNKYKKAFSNEELNLNLAAAYIGKAGYDVNSVINDIIQTGTDLNGYSFKLFAQAISYKISGKSIILLNKAIEKYSAILEGRSCLQDNLNDYQKDACFLKGLVNVAKGTVSFITLFDDNTDKRVDILNKWIEGVTPCGEDDINGNYIPDELDATACAIEFANSGSCSVPNSSIVISNVVFTSENNNYSYTLLEININPDISCSSTEKTFYKLIADSNVVITDGYCDVQFNSCDSLDGVNCFPCPVIYENKNLTVEDTVVQAINLGVDTVINILPENVQSDVKENLLEFKKDVCTASPSDCLCDGHVCTSSIDVKNAHELYITDKALARYLQR